MASPNAWLQLYNRTWIPNAWILTKRTIAYNLLFEREGNQNLAILVRGQTTTHSNRDQDGLISLLPFSSNLIVAQCTLHRPSEIICPSKASATASPNVRHHRLRQDPSEATPSGLAHRFYSLVLSTIAVAIVFFEEEHGLNSIVHYLAHWAHISKDQPRKRRPIVLVYRIGLPSYLPCDLESRVTGEILSSFNPLRDLSNKAAESIWQDAFDGLQSIFGRPNPTPRKLLEDTAKASLEERSPITGKQLCLQLETGCRHFTTNTVTVFDVRSLLPSPHIGELSRQTSQLLAQVSLPKQRSLNATKLSAAYRLVASALIMESFSHSPTGKTRACFVLAVAEVAKLVVAPYAENTFREQYSGILNVNASHVKVVRSTYVALVRLAALKGPNVVHTAVLSGVTALAPIRDASMCLTCLAQAPFYTFSCGHRFCNRCIHRANSGFENCRPPLCLICKQSNHASLILKPATAGVRILVLEGTIHESKYIAQFLVSLRKIVQVPLQQHFNMVIGKGVGIFFILMLFCKGASIEDCVYHLPQLQYIKINKRNFKFGRNLVVVSRGP